MIHWIQSEEFLDILGEDTQIMLLDTACGFSKHSFRFLSYSKIGENGENRRTRRLKLRSPATAKNERALLPR